MAKLQTKSDNINPFGGLFPISKTFDKSFLKENTVFLIATAILKNFYLCFPDMLRGRAEGVDCSTRIKRFVRK